MAEKIHQINLLFTVNDVARFSSSELHSSVNIGITSEDYPSISIEEMAHIDEDLLIEKTNSFFKNIEKTSGLSDISAYSNNFYECSILPLARYLKTLENHLQHLTNLKTSSKDINVVFPSKLLISTSYSSYFMSEHETQGYAFYDRQLVFQPYLEKLCKKHGVNISYRGNRLSIKSFIHRPVRILAVVVYRYINFLKHIFTSTIKSFDTSTDLNTKFDSEATKAVLVTRSKSQTEAIEGLIKNAEVPIVWIFGYSMIDLYSNGNLGREIHDESKFIDTRFIKPSLSSLILNDLSAILTLPLKTKLCINIEGIDVVFNQAIYEIIFMFSELKIYRDQVANTLKDCTHSSSMTFLTTEQKAPQAYVDAILAKQFGMPCIQVMQCDQDYYNLPCPIPGDAFITDTLESFQNFKIAWHRHADKLHYFGSIKKLNYSNSHDNLKRKTADQDLNLCIFLAMDDVASNIKVLEEASRLKSQVKIIIKIHPRDKLKNYSRFFDRFNFVDLSVRKNELLSSFDFAISFNSAVTLDLEVANKPYILLNFGRWSKIADGRDNTVNAFAVLDDVSLISFEVDRMIMNSIKKATTSNGEADNKLIARKLLHNILSTVIQK